MAEIRQFTIPPKVVSGTRHGPATRLDWVYSYNQTRGTWEYRVTYASPPQVFSSECATEEQAKEEVLRLVQTLPK